MNVHPDFSLRSSTLCKPAVSILDGTGGVRRCLSFELSKFCNLGCTHCYSDSGPVELRDPMGRTYWMSRLEQGAAEGIQHLQLVGGEPFLCDYLSDLVSHALEVGYVWVEVSSNLTVLNDGAVEVLKDARCEVSVSFYGADAEAHDRITRRTGSYRRSLRNIVTLLRAGVRVHVFLVGVSGPVETWGEVLNDLRGCGVLRATVTPVFAHSGSDPENRVASCDACNWDMIERIGSDGHTYRCGLESGEGRRTDCTSRVAPHPITFGFTR